METRTTSPALEVEVRHGADGAVVIQIVGALVVGNAARARRALDAVVDRSPGSLVVDLDAVSSIDVAGLAAVTAPALRGRRASIDTFVVAPADPVARRVVDRVGVVSILNRTRP